MSRRYTGAEARALREAATDGPWEWRQFGREACDALVSPSTWGGPGRGIVLDLGDAEPYENRHGECESVDDRALIAAAPDLAATVEALEAERDALAETCGLLGERLDRHAVRRAESYEAGRDAEREAVVAFLRREAQAVGRMRGISAAAGATIADALRTAADGIERGEHVAGGEP